MSDDDLADVIPLPRAAERERQKNEDARDLDAMGSTLKDWEPGACSHHKHRAQVDADARRLYCGGCGVEIDVWKFVIRMASDNDQLVSTRKWLRRDIALLRETLTELERLERNAKSRIRSAKKRAGLETNAAGWPTCPECGGDTLEDRSNPIPSSRGDLYCSNCRRVTARRGRAA